MDLAEQSRVLSLLRGEESRLMPEFNPYLQAAMGAAMTPTRENVVYQGQEGMLGQALGAFGTMATMGGIQAASQYIPF
jgi:hypothetical protein